MKLQLLIVFLAASFEATLADDCWWTGCQSDSWAVKGCDQYGRVEGQRRQCSGGNEYYCCAGGGGGGGSGGGSGDGGGDRKKPKSSEVILDCFCTDITLMFYFVRVANTITLEQFNQACRTRGGVGGADQYNSFIKSFPRAGIVDKNEAAKYLAHTVWESMGVSATREIFCLNPDNYWQCANAYGTGPGGVVYFGRGPIQLSHNYNYRAASQNIFGNPDVLLNDPDRVAREAQTGWNTAAYFWATNVHKNRQTFGSTLKSINGALECQGGSHGENMLKRCDHYRGILGMLGMPLPDRNQDCYCSAW